MNARLLVVLSSGAAVLAAGYLFLRGVVVRSGIPDTIPRENQTLAAEGKYNHPSISFLKLYEPIPDIEKASISFWGPRVNDDAVVVHREANQWVCDGRVLSGPDISIGLAGIVAQKKAHLLFILGRDSDSFGTMVTAADECRTLPVAVIYLVQCDYPPRNFKASEAPFRVPN